MSKESMQFDGRDWDTLGERGNLLAGEGWRYIGPKGKVRHKLSHPSDPTTYAYALCGQRAIYGTGTQAEYERLASLPKCLTCMRMGAP